MSVADTVNEWFRQRLAGGPLAQHTPAYNQVAAALPALIAELGGETAVAPASNAAAPEWQPAAEQQQDEGEHAGA